MISVRQRTLEAKLRAAESLARIHSQRAYASSVAWEKCKDRVAALRAMIDELARA